MKMSGSAFSLIFVMLVMVVVFTLSVQSEGLKMKLLPIIISLSVFAMAGAELFPELRRRAREASAEKAGQDRTGGKTESWGYIPISLWILGFFLAVYLLGFLVAIPFFIFAYMKSQKIKWTTTIIISGVILGLIYLVFEALLQVGLYGGVLLS